MSNQEATKSMARWVMLTTDANLPLMAEVLNISPVMARVMANRGIRSKKTALSFLKASIDNLYPFANMKCAAEAVTRISKAIATNENITVYGDYDADGVTSTVILYKLLKRLGAIVSYYIPHRITEGYGLNKQAIEKISTGLIIAVDNGISAIDEVAFANTLGIDIVIIDHHEPGEILPAAVAIVDPKQHDCPYPFKEMCAAGLVYKLAEALCFHLGVPFLEQEESLALAAIGTICDIVPLKDENRILVNCGLAILNTNKLINPGLGTLLTTRGYLDKQIDTFTIGFVLGPCINAAGRLASAATAVELLLSADIALAQELMSLNEERKQLTANCVDRLLASLPTEMDKVLVIVDNETHESLAGIVAGRIREATGRPSIVITRGEGAMKGSGRSAPCYNLFEALYANRHLFTRFGGHPMAAGLTMHEENIPLLRETLNSSCTLTEEDFLPITEIDCELRLVDITMQLVNELARLAPFGSGNKEPLFICRNLFVENIRVLNEKNTLIFTFGDGSGKVVKGIAFGLNGIYATAIAEANVDNACGYFMDVVCSVEANAYNGTVSAQMRVKDFVIYTYG